MEGDLSLIERKKKLSLVEDYGRVWSFDNVLGNLAIDFGSIYFSCLFYILPFFTAFSIGSSNADGEILGGKKRVDANLNEPQNLDIERRNSCLCLCLLEFGYGEGLGLWIGFHSYWRRIW